MDGERENFRSKEQKGRIINKRVYTLFHKTKLLLRNVNLDPIDTVLKIKMTTLNTSLLGVLCLKTSSALLWNFPKYIFVLPVFYQISF